MEERWTGSAMQGNPPRPHRSVVMTDRLVTEVHINDLRSVVAIDERPRDGYVRTIRTWATTSAHFLGRAPLASPARRLCGVLCGGLLRGGMEMYRGADSEVVPPRAAVTCHVADPSEAVVNVVPTMSSSTSVPRWPPPSPPHPRPRARQQRVVPERNLTPDALTTGQRAYPAAYPERWTMAPVECGSVLPQ